MLRWLSTLAVLTLHLMQLTSLVAAQNAQALSVAPFELEDALQAAEALDDAMSAARRATWSMGDAPVLPIHDDELPWCTAADDPRCAPLESTTHSIAHDRLVAPVLQAADSRLSAPAIEVAGFPSVVGLRAQPGVTFRVERPPRLR